MFFVNNRGERGDISFGGYLQQFKICAAKPIVVAEIVTELVMCVVIVIRVATLSPLPF